MADRFPPDGIRRAGQTGAEKSGKVADFRYKRPPQPDRNPPGNGWRDGRDSRSGPAAERGAAPRPRQAYAALDLGTNNCRLLIARPAEDGFTVIDAFSRVVRLGEDLAHTGRLSDAAMERTMGALHICAEKLKRRNVHLARSVATEACRRAVNGPEFIRRVQRETGIALDNISRVEGDAPERRARYAEMRRVVRDSFAPFADRVQERAGGSAAMRLLGTSGTVTTLASLHLELPQYDRRAVDGLIVPAQSMRDISLRLSTMTPAERGLLPCIGSDRAELVVAGCAILESIMDICPSDRLGVADRGIREGILRSLIAADRAGEATRRALNGGRR